MRCAAALSTIRNSTAALREVVDRLAETFCGESADLAMVFASMHHADILGEISSELTSRGLGRHILGCTGETIIGDGREVESEPALSAWAIQLPGAELKPMRIDQANDGLDSLQEFNSGPNSILLLGDPFSFTPDPWLQKLGAVARGLKVMGGMASGSQLPRQNRLLLNGQIFEEGAVGVVIGGKVAVRTLVSQGCRPIGRPMIVTKAERNLIRELGRRPCLEVLREVFEELSEADQERVQGGLHIGRVINEYQDTFRRGDFLIRNVMGADETEGLAITDLVRVGQTVQFQVRDAETADEDLRSLIDSELNDHAGASVLGALLFSCNGRGTRLFEEPDHDVSVILERFGPIPVAGFFAMGEIGPVGGQNFVHGYTASVVLFEDSSEDDR